MEREYRRCHFPTRCAGWRLAYLDESLQRDRNFVRQHPTAYHVHHSDQIDKAPGHGNIGGVQGPDLVGLGGGKLAQQVGVDLVAPALLCWCRFEAPSKSCPLCRSLSSSTGFTGCHSMLSSKNQERLRR